ncbi:MAG: S41 family peptidase [Leptolyngbyaceae cyanobacterium bins.349]|nr:S41 family peptidase [Leptolyngbyaceae cyanobacterium bins.349]
MPTLKITHTTRLKASTADSSKLPLNQMIEIPVGTLLDLKSYADAGANHYRIQLVGKLGDRDIWHVFQAHVQVLADAAIDSAQSGPPTAVSLRQFLATVGNLSLAERQLLVEQAIVLMERIYVHLPLKKAMHAVEPIQRLRLLQARLAETPETQMPGEIQFHNELTTIFTSVRDLHTNYILPDPFNQATAFLPFQVEEYFEEQQPRYLVSKVFSGLNHPTFKPGVEVMSWNGTAIAREIELNADRQAGSNIPARLARGLDALTIRPLVTSLPPNEEWVIVGYRTPDGKQQEIRLYWQIFTPEATTGGVNPNQLTAQATALGIDIQADAAQNAKKALFAPNVVAAEQRFAQAINPMTVPVRGLESRMPGIFRAQKVETPNGSFGYIRIFTFNEMDVDGFIAEFSRLIDLLPQTGLIIDVRGNGGGVILNGERLLQLLTPRPIEPERTEFINSPLTLEMVRLHSGPSRPYEDFDLSPWLPSMRQAVQTGAIYSSGFPITDVESANNLGQKYGGPVVLIIDALCYSTTDIFAAGFQDHQIGPVLGTSDNTGAGGANVWTHELFQVVLESAPNSPFKPLPKGANMRASVRRTVRVGDRAGTPVEDLGIVPDERHYLTKNDLLKGNVDLINRAASILTQLPAYALSVRVTTTSQDSLTVVVTTQNVSRVDVYLDGRPQRSLDVKNGDTTVQIPRFAHSSGLEVRGFAANRLVATRKVNL